MINHRETGRWLAGTIKYQLMLKNPSGSFYAAVNGWKLYSANNHLHGWDR